MPGNWGGSTRRERLPPDWPAKRMEADRRNPGRVCHWCKRPGGDELDHIVAGDDHRQENLDWIHGRRAVASGVSERNCHAEKTRLEALSGRVSEKRRREPHPGTG